MELISHIYANATFSSLSFKNKLSLENLASNQKNILIVKEHGPRLATPHHVMLLIKKSISS